MAGPVVETAFGKVEGITRSDGIRAFLGIPYGAPTGGANRFLPPRSPDPWGGISRTTTFGPAAPQDPSALTANSPAAKDALMAMGLLGEATSEDCLVLNVWTPGIDTARRPVMVWWHSGAFGIGSGAFRIERRDSMPLARRGDVVVVSVNHRLSVFGHLFLGDGFGEEYRTSGNVGMLDLAASLSWVRENISAFGGDPGNITVFGGSGGGAKVCASMAMPAFEGLYQHAICQSGHDLWKRNSVEAADRFSRAVLDHLGIKPGQTTKLRELSTDDIETACATTTASMVADPGAGAPPWVNADWFCPVIDGETMPSHPTEALAAGAAGDVNLVIGTSEHDHWNPLGIPGHQFGYPDDFGTMDYGRLCEHLRPQLGQRTEEIVSVYRAQRPGSTASVLLPTIVADRDWRVPAIRIAEARIAGGGRAPYMYFSKSTARPALVFDVDPAIGAARGLLSQLTPAWVGIARAGNPNHSDLPEWPEYSLDDRATMVFDFESSTVHDPWPVERAAWDAIRAPTRGSRGHAWRPDRPAEAFAQGVDLNTKLDSTVTASSIEGH